MTYMSDLLRYTADAKRDRLCFSKANALEDLADVLEDLVDVARADLDDGLKEFEADVATCMAVRALADAEGQWRVFDA